MIATTPDGEIIEYEKYSDFNQSLDEDGDILIGSLSFRRSEVLFQMDISAYLESANKYEETQFEELEDVIFKSLPSCIAYNYRLSEKGAGSNNPIQKLLHLRDTWESVIFILYALLWGEIRFRRIDLKAAKYFNGANELSFNTKVVFSDALKQKLETMRAIIKFTQDEGIDTKCSLYISFELIQFLNQLQNIRNDISHHATPTIEQAEADLQHVLPIFRQMLQKIEFLKDCMIVKFEEYRNNKARFQTFNGHSLNREFESYSINSTTLSYIFTDSPNPTDNILVKWEDELFSISPFLHFIHDQSGHESYLCFFKGRKESKYWFEPTKLRTEIAFDTLHAKYDLEKANIHSLIQQ